MGLKGVPRGHMFISEERKLDMPRFLITWAITAVSLWVAVQLIDGLTVDGGFWSYALIAAVFGLANAIIGTAIRMVTLPFVILSFGVLVLFINALMLVLTDALVASFDVNGFWAAFWGGVIVSLVTMALNFTIGDRLKASTA